MRISWIEPGVVRATRAALVAHRSVWEEFFTPEFEPPPAAPAGVPSNEWPRIAEHVARAERVSATIRTQGLEGAVSAFAESDHAVEVATVIAAAATVEQVTFELLASLLRCEIDPNVLYGSYLAMLIEVGRSDGAEARTIALYEEFCAALRAVSTPLPMWSDRVGAVFDGLASLYASCGRGDDAHALYATRHEDQSEDLVVALGASRAFLSGGHVARAVVWLEIAASRAVELGRAPMAERLRHKAEALARRLS